MSGSLNAVGPPEKLSVMHDLSNFDSGEPVLDEWLRRRALHNEASGSSRTYVVCADNKVGGYYTLAVGAVAHADATGRVRRNMPDPLPVMVLGRLAIDTGLQRRGVGRGLLRCCARCRRLTLPVSGRFLSMRSQRQRNVSMRDAGLSPRPSIP